MNLSLNVSGTEASTIISAKSSKGKKKIPVKVRKTKEKVEGMPAVLLCKQSARTEHKIIQIKSDLKRRQFSCFIFLYVCLHIIALSFYTCE